LAAAGINRGSEIGVIQELMRLKKMPLPKASNSLQSLEQALQELLQQTEETTRTE
jgi:hypothetical protein